MIALYVASAAFRLAFQTIIPVLLTYEAEYTKRPVALALAAI
jgi:hypothetical protein